jgi:hypothetical protein
LRQAGAVLHEGDGFRQVSQLVLFIDLLEYLYRMQAGCNDEPMMDDVAGKMAK